MGGLLSCLRLVSASEHQEALQNVELMRLKIVALETENKALEYKIKRIKDNAWELHETDRDKIAALKRDMMMRRRNSS